MRASVLSISLCMGLAACETEAIPGTNLTEVQCEGGFLGECGESQWIVGRDVAAGVPGSDRECITGYANVLRGMQDIGMHTWKLYGNHFINGCRDKGMVVYCGQLLGQDGELGTGFISKNGPISHADIFGSAYKTYPLPPTGGSLGFSDPNASCRDVIKYLAIAIGAGKPSKGSTITLAVRPSTHHCPEIAGVRSTVDRNDYGWPRCYYQMPGGAARMPQMLGWWARLILHQPDIYNQMLGWWARLILHQPDIYNRIRLKGLDLEAFKGCEVLRDIFVGGQVKNVTLGEEGTDAMVFHGRRIGGNIIDWCTSSGGEVKSNTEMEWTCAVPSLVNDLPTAF